MFTYSIIINYNSFIRLLFRFISLLLVISLYFIIRVITAIMWSDDKVNMLIDEYEKRKFLYTVKDMDYRNRVKKQIAYQEIAQVLGTTGEWPLAIVDAICDNVVFL
jgi:hypothetical protein